MAATAKGACAERLLSAVEALFESNHRFSNCHRLEEPEQGVGAEVMSYLLSGGNETIVVRIKSESATSTELEIKGMCYPLFDWGSTKRRVMLVLQFLREGRLSVEMNSLTKEHKMVGPFRITGAG